MLSAVLLISIVQHKLWSTSHLFSNLTEWCLKWFLEQDQVYYMPSPAFSQWPLGLQSTFTPMPHLTVCLIVSYSSKSVHDDVRQGRLYCKKILRISMFHLSVCNSWRDSKPCLGWALSPTRFETTLLLFPPNEYLRRLESFYWLQPFLTLPSFPCRYFFFDNFFNQVLCSGSELILPFCFVNILLVSYSKVHEWSNKTG